VEDIGISIDNESISEPPLPGMEEMLAKMGRGYRTWSEFTIETTIRYLEESREGADCTLMWEENITHPVPFAEALGVKPNQWFDYYGHVNSPTFNEWNSRDSNSRAPQQIKSPDPPGWAGIGVRVLQFRITIESGAYCQDKCVSSTATVEAKQTISNTPGRPGLATFEITKVELR